MALPECATPTVTGLVGGRATLRCPGSGNPVPRRSWTRDGIEVTSAGSPVRGRVMLSSDNNLLTISDLVEGDSGLYSCSLFNIIAALTTPNFTDSLDVLLEVQSEWSVHVCLLCIQFAVFFTRPERNVVYSASWII